ncbi:MAG TPA: helix-turn-helix transcriptional regulator [Candidatus Caccomorpha excrementavium]|nr:helix-turn-helix transcriptional regulator [Candidatus Caccomorpha excrementavium]
MKFERIRNLREDKDITQTQMAEYLYIKQTTYSKYERGTINIPVDTLIRLADYFDVSLDYLVGRTNEREWKRKK